mgnify:CR=1 FL=1
MELLLTLLLAHFLGDFVLQPSKWVKDKEAKSIKSKYFWFHIAIHFILMVLLTGFELKLTPIVIFITISHIIIDFFKIKLQEKFSSIILFFIDQVLHLLMISLAIGLDQEIDWMNLYPNQQKIIFIALAFVLLTNVTGVIMKVFLSKWKLNDFEGESLENAGLYIGILERLFIFGFVFLDYWEGIGFLIAAKSIFRFSDLTRAKDRKLTEYVLIGTLLSYGIAMLIALASVQIWY